jgi:tetratricopeptide (TPR) repeat protein
LRNEQRSDASHKAIDKYLTAAGLWNSVGDSESEAQAITSAGEVFKLLANLIRAIESFKRALELTKKAKSPAAQGRVLNGLAYTYFIKGEPKAAYDAVLRSQNQQTTWRQTH